MTRRRNLELQMPDYIRGVIVERHTFFVREAKRRLLNQFEDIAGEADRYEQEMWESAIQAPYYGDDPDMGSLAEGVRDEAVGHYMLLDEMQKQVRLSTTAAMFHQWDKELREYIDREFAHYVERAWIDKKIWNAKTIDLFNMFEEFGWPAKQQAFYSLIDACNLIVNVYKHGKGPALNRLHDEYPQYLSELGIQSWTGTLYLDHRWLEVTDAHFDAFGEAFEAFWRTMPESLVYVFPDAAE